MDFEKAYQKFLNGTASPEETEFVRSEMKKASAVNDILDNVKKEGATKEACGDKVHKAIKKYNVKTTVRIAVVVASALLILSIFAALAVAIPVFSNARDNVNYSKDQAREIAIQYVAEKYPENADKVSVRRIEKDVEVYGRLKNARYIYVLDVYNGDNRVIEIEVDSKSGEIVDVDIDDDFDWD